MKQSTRMGPCFFLGVALLTSTLHAYEQRRTPTWTPTGVPGVEARIHTGSPYHHLKLGDEGQLAWVIKNGGAAQKKLELVYSIESYSKSKCENRFSFELKSSEEHRQPISRDELGERGIKWVTFHLTDGERNTEEQTLSFVYFQPAGPTPGRQQGGFLFSTGYGGGPEPFNEENQELIALAGFKAARFNPGWGTIQPQKDVWNWDRLDQAVAHHLKYGMEPQFLLYGTPRWAVNEKAVQFHADPTIRKRQEQFHKRPSQNWPPHLDAYRQFASALARRYGDRVRYYEMWNEPDINFYIGSVEYYVKMLEAGYRGVKSADPDLHVISGGIASLYHNLRKPGMVDAILRDGKPYFDSYGHHRHGEFRFFVEEVPLVQALMKKYDVRQPIFFTETAMDSRFGERHQAETLIKKAVHSWSLGAVGYTWFNVHDSYNPARKHGEFYGLYTFAGFPKAAYAAHATLARNLLNLSYKQKYDLGTDSLYAYAFAGDGRTVLVAWNEDPAASAPHLVLRTDSSRVEKIDVMGNSEELTVRDEAVLMVLEDKPFFYVFHETDKPPATGGLLVASSGINYAVPGKNLPLKVDFWNPMSATLPVRTTFRAPVALGGHSESRELDLQPAVESTEVFGIAIPSTFRGAESSEMNARLDYEIPCLGWNGSLQIPVQDVLFIQAGDYAETPAWTLDNARQVVNATDADPTAAYLVWKGPQDLNASGWFACSGDSLKIRVQVNDNAFFQPGGEHFAQGDHLQIVIALPGWNGKCWDLAVFDQEGAGQCRILAGPDNSSAGNLEPNRIRATVERQERRTTYEVALPIDSLGLTQRQLEAGIRFNIAVHDNDGQGYKGWMELAPGAVRKSAASSHPLAILPRN